MKKILIIGAMIVGSGIFAGCGGSGVNETGATESSVESSAEVSKLTITLNGDELGEYGKKVTYNRGTEFENTRNAYYVPAGTYTVTNTGKYKGQFNVYSDEIVVNENGYEEPADGNATLLDVGGTSTITIKQGYHVEIMKQDSFELAQQWNIYLLTLR